MISLSSLTCICVKELCPLNCVITSSPSSRSELLPSKSCGLLSDSSSAKKIIWRFITQTDSSEWNSENCAILITRKFKWIVYHFPRFVLSPATVLKNSCKVLNVVWYSPSPVELMNEWTNLFSKHFWRMIFIQVNVSLNLSAWLKQNDRVDRRWEATAQKISFSLLHKEYKWTCFLFHGDKETMMMKSGQKCRMCVKLSKSLSGASPWTAWWNSIKLYEQESALQCD